MRGELLELIKTGLQGGLSIILSFLDDALLLGLTKIGVSLPWLQWLSMALLSITILYWTLRIARFLSQRYFENTIDA